MPKNNIQKGYADSDGARLYYEILGEGPELVLVHAGVADRRMWDDQFEAFAERFRVVRYDQRGFGETKYVDRPFSHRGDLHNLLRHLNIGRAHLAGASAGSGIVLDFALEYPEAAASLLLIAPSVSGYRLPGPPPPQVLELIAARRAGDIDRAVELQVEVWAGGKTDERVRERLRDMGRRALDMQAPYLKETGFLPETQPEASAADRLAEVAASVLAVYGDLDDETVGEVADALTAGCPRGRWAIIPGTAHFPNMERPAVFNRIALDFWERLRPQAPPAEE
ncbi:MAG: alpha/beta hydrolase [Spirochaetales bacterium]|nr:alpha/beta hydrolase [Spirochaetales bacterium]